MRLARLVPPSGQDKKLQAGGFIPKAVLQQAVPLDLLHLNAVGGDLLIPSLKVVVEGGYASELLRLRAAQHGAEPDTAVPADGHVADNRGRIGQKGIFSDNGNESPERSDKCHIYPYFVYVSKTAR